VFHLMRRTSLVRYDAAGVVFVVAPIAKSVEFHRTARRRPLSGRTLLILKRETGLERAISTANLLTLHLLAPC